MLAEKEELFDHASTWKGRHVAAACLLSRRSGAAVVVASAYSPTVHTLQDELWEDIHCYTYRQRLPCNPQGRRLTEWRWQSCQFWDVLALLGMAEMGPADCRFTWRGPTSQSRLDRFLCSSELLAAFLWWRCLP